MISRIRAESVRVAFRAIIALIVVGMAAPAAAIERDARGRIARSAAEKHAFMKAQPCPGGVDVGSTRRCRGYVVDHIEPLACGGPDLPSNMQWQTIAAGKIKDAWERRACGGQ